MSTTYHYESSIQECIRILTNWNKNPVFDPDTRLLHWTDNPQDRGNHEYAVQLKEKVHEQPSMTELLMDKGFTPYWNGQQLLATYLEEIGIEYLYAD